MNCYDIIIVGGGPAGLTAGIYATRGRMKTILLEKMILGGQVGSVDWIENYPGFPEGILGPELAERMEGQAKKFGLETARAEVIGLSKSKKEGRGWAVLTKDEEYEVLAVIIATGSQPPKLNIPGEERLLGKGISYCATCDGPLFRDKDVLIVGGGDTALTEALFLAKFASKVTIIHRRERLRATKILQEKVLANPKIEFVLSSVVTQVLGKDILLGVRVRDVRTNNEEEIQASGLFIFVGQKPNTSFLGDLIDLDGAGFIITDSQMRTSREGIYAAGDIRSTPLRQIATACGDGAMAAFSAQHYLESIGNYTATDGHGCSPKNIKT